MADALGLALLLLAALAAAAPTTLAHPDHDAAAADKLTAGGRRSLASAAAAPAVTFTSLGCYADKRRSPGEPSTWDMVYPSRALPVKQWIYDMTPAKCAAAAQKRGSPVFGLQVHMRACVAHNHHNDCMVSDAVYMAGRTDCGSEAPVLVKAGMREVAVHTFTLGLATCTVCTTMDSPPAPG